MDSPDYNNDETRWVEERIARLSPPPEWRPDTDKAFEQVMQRARTPSTSSGLRLLMAGATLAVIGAVVVLLPWKAVWAPESSEGIAVAPIAARTAQTGPETPAAGQVFTGVVPIPEDPTPQDNPKEPASKELKQNTPVPAPDAHVAPLQREPEVIQQIPDRRKKEPRPIIAAAETQQDAVPPIAQAQEPQTPSGRVTEPIVISQVQPGYTQEAREARIQGTVEVAATVREDGTVKVERIVRGLGFGLDEAAAAAVEQWKFIPGKKDGQPVAVTINILINFTLRK